MAATPLRTLLFLGGATVAAVGVAYVSGALDPWLAGRAPAPVPQVASTPEPTATPPAPEPAKPEQQAAIAPAQQQPAQQQPAPAVAAPQPQPAEEPAPQSDPVAPGVAEPLSPTFDVLRVEPDGSIVIAGRALANSEVEILSGSKVLAKVSTNAEGDFVAVLDDPLKPGDYQIVLRATTPAGVVASSKETAIVSIPETADGQVLALVEEAGAPSRLITVPEPVTPGAAAATPAPQPQEGTATAPTDAAAAQAQPAPQAETKADRPGPVVKIAVDAVEIDGRKIFVAGGSEPGNTVRIYANEILLGDAKVTPEGRFLLETERDLPVGDYVIRADVLGPDGAKVIARAAVPFAREEGETVSAVAPHVPNPSEQAAPEGEAREGEAPEGEATGAASSAAPSAPAPDAQAQSETLAPKLEAVDGSVIIRRGDSLWRISKRVYGRGIRYSTIYLANQEQIKDPDMIWPGQIFRVPEKTDEGEKADLEAIEAPAPATVQ